MITDINEYRLVLESMKQSVNESVDKKDWERMLKLVLAKDDGEKVALSIKDKDKAMARYIAGVKLQGGEVRGSMNYHNVMEISGPFSAFGNRAIALGATMEDITALFNSTVVPQAYADNLTTLSTKKLANRFVGQLSRAIIDAGFDITYLPNNGNAITMTGREAMSRNGRKWTIGYNTEVTVGDRTLNLVFDAITDEGGGPSSYVLDHRSDAVFKSKIQTDRELGIMGFQNLIVAALKGIAA
jgi:hypothetical protein